MLSKWREDVSMEWSYSGENGPEHWHSLCQEFQKAETETPTQSPIALKSITAQKEAQGEKNFGYKPQKMEFETSFVNHTIHLTPDPSEEVSEVNFKGKSYLLNDIHAHLPSEHTIDEKFFQLEIHLVHRSKDEKVLVLAIMAKTGSAVKEDKTLEEYIHFFSKKNLEKQRKLTLDIGALLPGKSSFFHYSGSLTTPPTTGPVQWIVMKTPILLSNELLEGFKHSIGKTNRPVQPDLNRPVFLYE